MIVYRYCVDIVRMLRAVLLLTVLLALSPPSSAWYPYYRPFPFVRRPARPHNPIIVQADRVKVDNIQLGQFRVNPPRLLLEVGGTST